jgi:hypothetical protein
MRTTILLALIVLSSFALLAADKPTPLNLKEGLWEVTTTHSVTGMPGMPPDALAKMTPDQRAQVEAMMKQKGLGGGPSTNVIKNCVTREKIEKGLAFSDSRENCTRTIVSSSARHLEMKFHCEDKKSTDGSKTGSDGTIVVDAIGSDNVKGSTHIVTNSNGRNMNMDLTFTSKYLGAACGDVK